MLTVSENGKDNLMCTFIKSYLDRKQVKLNEAATPMVGYPGETTISLRKEVFHINVYCYIFFFKVSRFLKILNAI